jgi:hypothetical protein
MSFEITKTIHIFAFKTFELEIIERTPTTLKLEGKRNLVLFSILLGGIPFVIVGLAIIISWAKLTTLKCDRLTPTQVACELTSSSLLEEHITPIPVGEFQGAELKVKESSNGTTYGVTLLTKKKDIPLSDWRSSSKKVNYKKVKEINDFISNSEQMSLRIQQDDRWFLYPFGGIFALIGSSVIVNTLMKKLDITCIFDKDADRMYLKRQNIFKKAETREEILYEIKKAQIVKKTDKEGNKIYNIKLILRSGDEITLLPLDISYNPYKITQSINHFLYHQYR